MLIVYLYSFGNNIWEGDKEKDKVYSLLSDNTSSTWSRKETEPKSKDKDPLFLQSLLYNPTWWYWRWAIFVDTSTFPAIGNRGYRAKWILVGYLFFKTQPTILSWGPRIGPNLAVFRSYSWLCTQRWFLEMLGRQSGVPEIKLRAVCKTSAIPSDLFLWPLQF